VYAASEQQCTAAGEEVQALKGGIYVTSDRRWSKEIDSQIGIANAVLHDLYSSVVMKQFSNAAKLSVFKLVCVLILTYHESWLMTKRLLSQVQTTKISK